MATMKISEYAENQGISVPAVHKRVKAGKIKAVVIDGIKHIEIDHDHKPKSATSNKPDSTEVKPVNQSKLKKENTQLKEKIKTLEIAKARLEEKVLGKDETITHLKEQQKNVILSMQENSNDLKKTIGTFADLERERIQVLIHQKSIDDIKPEDKPIKPKSLTAGLNYGLAIGLLFLILVAISFSEGTLIIEFLSGLGWFN